VDPCLLLQIGRQPLGRPDVEGEPQLRRRRLQRAFHGGQVDGIGVHGSTGTGRIRERRHSAFRKACQPVLDTGYRAPAPAGDALHVVTQRRSFDHLQPLAQAPRQIRASQLLLHFLALLAGDGDAHHAAPHSAARLPILAFQSSILLSHAIYQRILSGESHCAVWS
jgi:hypothetical protein